MIQDKMRMGLLKSLAACLVVLSPNYKIMTFYVYELLHSEL
jgi:hypothetical protein